jgi:Skp family chaperone for outer membrane proteins
MRSLTSFFGLALLGAIALPAICVAQTAPAPAPVPAGPVLAPPTIAIVDTQRVIYESAAGKSIQGQLATEQKKIRDQLTKLQDEIKAAENDFRRQETILSPEARNTQVQALQRREGDLQRAAQERQEALYKAQNDAVAVIGDNLRDIVQQIALERRIGLVLSKQSVLSMSDKNMDLTDDVVQRLNSKLPSVTVTVPAAGTAQAAAGDVQGAPPAAPPAKSAGKK